MDKVFRYLCCGPFSQHVHVLCKCQEMQCSAVFVRKHLFCMRYMAHQASNNLIIYRMVLRNLITSTIDKARKAEAIDKTGPSHGTSLTITLESQKQHQKLERKERKDRRKQGGVAGKFDSVSGTSMACVIPEHLVQSRILDEIAVL